MHFLNTPAKMNVESIKDIDFSPDKFIIKGKEIYLHIPEGYGENRNYAIILKKIEDNSNNKKPEYSK